MLVIIACNVLEAEVACRMEMERRFLVVPPQQVIRFTADESTIHVVPEPAGS